MICILIVGINAGYKVLEKDETTKFKNIPNNIQICNFGSSHGLYGYCYDNISEDYVCFNFGLASQSLSYDYRILVNYQDRLREGAMVFITVSYFSLFGKGEIYENDFESKNQRYYKFLPASLIKEYSPLTDFYIARFPVLSAYEDIIKVFLGQSRDTTDSYWQQSTDMDNLDSYTQGAYGRHIINDKLNEKGERIYNQEEISALYDMINLCESCGFIPVLITPPYLSEYTGAVQNGSPDFYDDFYSVINKIVEDTGVQYHDYSMDSRFNIDYSLFINSDHLNKDGARKFVSILMEEIFNAKP